MWRAVGAVALVGACRINFDPTGATSDASSDPDARDGATPDGSSDAPATSPLVQSAFVDVAGPAVQTIDMNDGLAPVTAGNTVIVTCGRFSGVGQCNPTSVPATTWQELDGGTTLGVYVACNAPAITSITAQNGGNAMKLHVSEWTGIADANCVDVQRISTPCNTGPSAWNTGLTPTTTVNNLLLISVALAGGASFTVDAPFTEALEADPGVSGIVVHQTYQRVDAAPTTYAATGTVTAWNVACFTDLFAFKAQ